MKVYFVVLIMLVSLFIGCTNADQTKRILSDQGYTNIEITGYAWFSCGQDDWIRTSFIAVSPAKKYVKGAVCSGFIFKNSTIRFE